MRSFLQCRKGTTAIEFAFVAMPLIMLIGAICELGLFFGIQADVELGVSVTARNIWLGNNTQVTTLQGFKDLVCAQITLVQDCSKRLNVDVRSASTFQGLKNVVPHPIDVGPTTLTGAYAGSFDPGVDGKAVSVIVTYDWQFIFPFMRIFSNLAHIPESRRLMAVTVFRREG